VGDILDEIFGGIVNEFRGEEPFPERLPDGRVRLPGSLRLDDVADWIGVHWQGDAYTVAGLVAEALGRVPRAGEHTEIGGVPVEVERVQSLAARIEDVGSALGTLLEHQEVDTVSGLVLAYLGRPPGIGDVVVYQNVRLEVSSVRGRGVGRCAITRLK
jgi:CBS domain containing-hemolysin-like protein